MSILRAALTWTALILAPGGGLVLLAGDPPQKAKQPSTDKSKERPAAWLSLDLTPALSAPLLTDHILDDGVSVRASPGRVFVTLPFRYDSNAGPATVSRSAIRGAEGKRFYGLRLLEVSKGRAKLGISRDEPIYERVSLQPRESGRLLLSARNTMGPRRDEGGKTRQEPLKAASVSAAASGWLAMIVEAPEQAGILKLDLAGVGELEIDLDLIRRVREEPLPAAHNNPASPPVSAILKKVESPSSATACLAIGWLATTREKLGTDAPAAWVDQVDAAVIAAGGREQVDVRAAAWGYISSCKDLSEKTLRHITRQKPEVRRRWCWLVEDHLAGAAKPKAGIATQVLAAVLAGEDEASCEAALDVALAYADVIRCEQLHGLSAKAQSLVMARLDSGMDQTQAVRWLDVLLKDGKPSLAGEIAARAKRFSVQIGRPDHPMLLQWREEKNAARKRAIVTALAAADMTDVVYSELFAKLVEEATTSRSDPALREAAFSLLIRQAERRYGVSPFLTGEGTRRDADGAESRALRGCFPMRLTKKARDPLVEGLARAAQESPDPMRADATALLLVGGFVEKAEAVVRGVKPDSDRIALLKAMMVHSHAASTYGLAALLGGVLDKEHASSSGLILRYLDEEAERLGKSDRWRLAAAIKAGVRFDRLYELSSTLGPEESPLAERWLVELGHMSSQDRQRLAVPGGSDDRVARLERIDNRRAGLVDGRYGVLATVEVLVSEEQQRLAKSRAVGSEDDEETEEVEPPTAPSSYRWRAPRLVTVALPPLRIVSSDVDASYQVMWEDRRLGEGRIRRGHRPIQDPDAFCDRLAEARQSSPDSQGWGWRIEELLIQDDALRELLRRTLGPAVLPSGGLEEQAGEDMMSLEIGEYLRTGLRRAFTSAKGEADPNRWVPKELPIMLRYSSFGGFHGAGERSRLPAAISAGKWQLQNVAIVLEKID
jgi:hypothetical protein